ncbi:MAG: hypothetical protein AAF502_07515 [Bacteroidota bacterium]
MKTIFYSILLIVSFLFSFSGCKLSNQKGGENDQRSSQAILELLPVNHTGIEVTNDLFEGPSDNILFYDYMYNGGGVAIVDINNDGLQTIVINIGKNGFIEVESLS